MGRKGSLSVFLIFLVTFTPTSYSQNPQELLPVQNKSNLKRILRFFGIGGSLDGTGNHQVNPQFHQFNPCPIPTATTPAPIGPICPYPFPGQYQPLIGQPIDPNQPGGYPLIGPPLTPNQPGYVVPTGNPNLVGPPFTPNQPNYPNSLRPPNPNNPDEREGEDGPVFILTPNGKPTGFIPNPKYNIGSEAPFLPNPIPGAEPPYIVNPKFNLGPIPPFILNPELNGQYPFVLNPKFNVGPVPAFIPNKFGQIIPNPEYKNSGPEPNFIPNIQIDGTLGQPPFVRNPKAVGLDGEQPFIPNPFLNGRPPFVPNPNFNREPIRVFVRNPSGQPPYIINPTFTQRPHVQNPSGPSPTENKPNEPTPPKKTSEEEPVFIRNPKGQPPFIINPKYNLGPDPPFFQNPVPGAEPPYINNPKYNLGPVPPFIPNPALQNQPPYILNPNMLKNPNPLFIRNPDGLPIPNPNLPQGPASPFIPNILPGGILGQPPFVRNPQYTGPPVERPFIPNPVLNGQPPYIPNPAFNQEPNRVFVPNPSGQPPYILASKGPNSDPYKPHAAPKPPTEDKPNGGNTDNPGNNPGQPVNADPSHKPSPAQDPNKPIIVDPLNPQNPNKPIVVHPTDPLNPNVPVAVHPDKPVNPNEPVVVVPQDPNDPKAHGSINPPVVFPPVNPVDPTNPHGPNSNQPNVIPINPNTGKPYDPNTGKPYDPNTGKPYDPNTGRPYDPNTGKPYDPNTGRPYDPNTGKPYDPNTGRPYDPNTGKPYDPNTGKPYDPNTGKPYDPNTGKPYDPNTGKPIYVPLPPPDHPDIPAHPFPYPGPFADPAHDHPMSRPLPCSVLRAFTPAGYSPVTVNSSQYSAFCPFLNPAVRDEPACPTLESLEILGAKKFRDLIVNAGLKQFFEQTDGYTVFAPLDIAFNRLPNWLITTLQTDQKLRQAFVLNHFVKIDVPISHMENEDLVPNARPGKNWIRINVYHADTQYSIYSADGARLLRGDILSAKGRIHLTDKVIMPNPPRNAAEYLSEKAEFEDFWNLVKNLDLSIFQSDRPITVFIPVNGGCPGINKNILLGDHEKLTNFRDYHVVNRTVYSSGIINGEYVTTNYEKEIKLGVTSDMFSKQLSTINAHIKFLKADIPLVNGVAHVIDQCISEKVPFYAFEDSDEFEMEFGVISRRSMKVYGEEKELFF